MELKLCCGKFQDSWRDGYLYLHLSYDMTIAFKISKKENTNAYGSEISHCPYCGKKINIEPREQK